MNKQLTIIGTLCLVLVTAIVGKAIFFQRLSQVNNSIFWMFMALCAIITLVLCVNQLIEGRRNTCKPKQPAGSCQDGSNRRKSFRVTYPANLRPLLIVDKIDNIKKRPLEYAVVDISEEGIRFINDGSLGQAKSLAGKLQFHNGETKIITCEIVRRDGQHVCVQLRHGIAWATLLNEQRRMMGANYRS